MQRIATRNQGRCVRCFHRAKAIPPQDFQVPHDLAVRVALLNENLEFCRQLTWQHGKDFVHEFLDRQEKRRQHYFEWFPRLRDFADQCRVDNPPPADESLSNEERAQQQIYQKKFSDDTPLSGREMNVVLYTMPVLAMPVAYRLWPDSNLYTVFLTLFETERWNDCYSPLEGCVEWYSHYTWRIDTSPAQTLELSDDHIIKQWEPDDIPNNEQPWLVSVSQYHGPLAAAGHTELWSWNGSRVRFIKDVSMWVS